MTARETALKILFEVEKNGAYSDLALKNVLSHSELSAADRALATELTYGVVRMRLHLDFIIEKYSSQPLKKLSVWIISILRMGMYQLFFMDRVPASAAVNEGVKLAKRYGHDASARFVNAVLRAAANGGQVVCPTIESYYSHPKWMVELLESQYPEEYKKILAANNLPAPITVRVNTTKTSARQLCDSLAQKEITAYPDDGGLPLLTLEKARDIAALEQYQDGLFTPQDKGGYLAAANIPSTAELIIDVCAAPGGKTTQIAEAAGDKTELIAFDIHPHKIELINKNAARLGLKSIKAVLHDATGLMTEYIGRADAVLADVPCSGLGIIRKKPDIKWTKKPEEIDEIINIQKRILRTAAEYVKSGGTLVYSTCTINRYENQAVVDEFLTSSPFVKVKEAQLLTHIDNCDGFYFCVMRRQ